MSRNPMAGSLKHFRQRIVPDKREVLRKRNAEQGHEGWEADDEGIPGG